MGTKRPEDAMPPVEADSEGAAFDQVVAAGSGLCYWMDDCADFLLQDDHGQSTNNDGKRHEQ